MLPTSYKHAGGAPAQSALAPNVSRAKATSPETGIEAGSMWKAGKRRAPRLALGAWRVSALQLAVDSRLPARPVIRAPARTCEQDQDQHWAQQERDQGRMRDGSGAFEHPSSPVSLPA